jgi:hypothetical protein
MYPRAEAITPRTAWAARILLIDDEQRVLRFVSRGLRAEGYTVDLADNGTDGLRMALTGSYPAAAPRRRSLLPHDPNNDEANNGRRPGSSLNAIRFAGLSGGEPRINGTGWEGGDAAMWPGWHGVAGRRQPGAVD